MLDMYTFVYPLVNASVIIYALYLYTVASLQQQQQRWYTCTTAMTVIVYFKYIFLVSMSICFVAGLLGT